MKTVFVLIRYIENQTEVLGVFSSIKEAHEAIALTVYANDLFSVKEFKINVL